MATGIGSLGGGTGTFFIAPLVSYLLVHHGWRHAYAVTGIVSVVLICGAAMLMWRDPQSKNHSLPYGAGEVLPDSPAPSASSITGMSLSEAMRTRVFWTFILMFGLWWFGGSIVYTQLAPFVLEKGFDIAFASWVVIGFGAGNGIGKIAMGVLTDRLGGRLTYRLATALAIGSMLALAQCRTPWLLVGLSTAFGIGFGGATPQLTTLTVELFGLKAIGLLMGTVMACMGLIGSGGPVFSGFVYDRTGSYTLAYVLGAAILAISVSLSFGLRLPASPSVSSTSYPTARHGDSAGP